ncbi:MAG: hypothetical protein EOP84_36240 [Verrucomicrobiaceae bacterium]|nr:MAG: hypothetical protein EOP84_36240 [Verrucomicrobiaceae bacterium]
MKFFPFFLSALFLVAFSFPSLGQEAGDVGDDSKKIRLMDSATELANSFEDEIHRQVDQSVLNSAQLKFMRPKSIKTFPILWQSYLWMEYDLNEEVIMIAAVTTEAGEIRSLLIRATRSP